MYNVTSWEGHMWLINRRFLSKDGSARACVEFWHACQPIFITPISYSVFASFSTHRVHVEHHVVIHHMIFYWCSCDLHQCLALFITVCAVGQAGEKCVMHNLLKDEICMAPFIVTRLPLPLVVMLFFECNSIHNELS